MQDPPLMLELEIEVRRAEAKRQLAPRRRKPSPSSQAGEWRARFAACLVALGLWLDPRVGRVVLARRSRAR